MYFFLLLAMIIAIAIVLFAVQNASIVTVSFLSFDFDGSFAFILIVVFSAGLITGVLMGLPSIFRKSIALRDQKRKVKELEGKISTGSAAPSQAAEREDTDSL